MPVINPPSTAGLKLPGILSTGLPQLASRGLISTSASNGTDLKTTSRTRYYLPNKCSDLRLVFANVTCNTAGSEAVATTPITVSAALEYPVGTVNPLTFNGQPTVTIPAGSIVISDPCGLDFAAGTVIWTRQCVAQGGSTVWPQVTQTVYNVSLGDSYGVQISGATNATPIVIQTSGPHNFTTGDTATVSGVTGNTAANGVAWVVTKVDATHFSLNTSVGNGVYNAGTGYAIGSDLTLAGSSAMTGSGGVSVFAPVAIIGTLPYATKQPYVVILGDSIARGSGETTADSSWIIRGLGGSLTPTIPYINLAVPGTYASQFADLTNAPTQSEKRRRIGMGAAYVVVPYGTNDFSNARTLAQIQADELSICSSVAARGGRTIISTIFPKTTSSDAWATVVNQTVTANETVRANYNTWVRGGCPISAGVAVAVGTAGALIAGQSDHPVWTTMDPCAYVEVNTSNVLTLNGGRWLSNGSANYPTTDGTHPTSALAILASAAVPTSQIVAY